MTNIQEIKRISKILLEQPINDLGYGLCSHPFTFSIHAWNGSDKIIDLTDKKNFEFWKEGVRNVIDGINDPYRISSLINKPYRLTWLHFCHEYFSDEDFGKLFGDIWISSEDPNNDVNVPLEISISYFRNYSNFIMDKNEKDIINKISKNGITLYRGVSKGRNPYGLSYTDDKEIAEWFSTRFGNGYVINLHVNKDDCLCYLDRRGENEYVVDTKKYRSQIKSFT